MTICFSIYISVLYLVSKQSDYLMITSSEHTELPENTLVTGTWKLGFCLTDPISIELQDIFRFAVFFCTKYKVAGQRLLYSLFVLVLMNLSLADKGRGRWDFQRML